MEAGIVFFPACVRPTHGDHMTSLHHQLVRSWANQRDHLTGSHSAPVPCWKEADECEPVCLVCFCVRTQWIVSYFCILFVFFERHNVKTEHQLPTAMCSLARLLDCAATKKRAHQPLDRSCCTHDWWSPWAPDTWCSRAVPTLRIIPVDTV